MYAFIGGWGGVCRPVFAPRLFLSRPLKSAGSKGPSHRTRISPQRLKYRWWRAITPRLGFTSPAATATTTANRPDRGHVLSLIGINRVRSFFQVPIRKKQAEQAAGQRPAGEGKVCKNN